MLTRISFGLVTVILWQLLPAISETATWAKCKRGTKNYKDINILKLMLRAF